MLLAVVFVMVCLRCCGAIPPKPSLVTVAVSVLVVVVGGAGAAGSVVTGSNFRRTRRSPTAEAEVVVGDPPLIGCDNLRVTVLDNPDVPQSNRSTAKSYRVCD